VRRLLCTRRMKRIVTVVGCLLGVSSWAQDSFEFRTVVTEAGQYIFVGPGHCADTMHVNWVYLLAVRGTPNDSLQIWATPEASCGDQPMSGDQLFTSVSWPVVASTRSGGFELPLPSLPMFDGGTCPTTTSTALICASMPYLYSGSIGGMTQYAKGTGFIVYDPDPPAAPVITDSTGGSDWIDVEFVAPSDATTVTLEVRRPSDADFVRHGTDLADAGHTSAGGFQNGVACRVRLIATDAAGNESDPSNEVTVTPVAPEVDAGAPDDGNEPKRGCTTAPGLFVALAALWLRRRSVSSR
jgi:hypothetical protein